MLIGQAVTPTVLASELQLLADALVPEQLAADEQVAHDGRSLVLRKKQLSPGWRLDAHLTDEVGAAFRAEIDARAQARRQAEARLRSAAATGSDDPDAFGQAGPGTPATDRGAFGNDGEGSTVDAPPRRSDDQLAHDLLGELLEDLDGVCVPGAPAPTPLTITANLDTVEGKLGALPGTLLLPTGPVPLSTAATRRHGCHSRRARTPRPARQVGRLLRRQRLRQHAHRPPPRQPLVADRPHQTRRPRPPVQGQPPRHPRRQAHPAAARRTSHRREPAGWRKTQQ